MKTKIKECKGIGDCKGKGCGKPHVKRLYGLCPSCLYEWSKSTDTGRAWYDKRLIKVNKPKHDLEKAKVNKQQGISLESLKKSTTNSVHRYIRKRDEGKPCISCGTPWKSNFQAGHCFKAELFSSLKYHDHNINGQCEQCNLRREGNESGYLLRLPNMITLTCFNELKTLAVEDKKKIHKWDRETLKRIRTNANLLYKKLEYN